MATVGLLGASGMTGRLVASQLSSRGHRFVAAGREPARVEGVLGDVAGVAEIAVVDVRDGSSLQDLCERVDVLLTTVGPFEELGRPVVAAAIEGGAHYVDSTGELPFIRWVFDRWGARAAERGVAVVPAAGFDFLPGDLLAALAAGAVGDPVEVHVTYAVPSSVGAVRGVTRGTRASIAGLLGQPGVARVDGRLEPEMPGEERRLAWFPRPVGPRHAAGFPGAEPITVPRHVGGLQTVRTYVALPSWQAELLQFGSNVTRWDPARKLAERMLRAGPEGSRRSQTRTRWACVAESHGSQGVARAWSYGSDIYQFTAAAMTLVAEAMIDGTGTSGVLAPAELLDPATALDALADRVGVRWSVTRPDPGSDPQVT